MERLGSCALQFDANDFLLALYGSPDAASPSDSPVPPSKFDQVQSEATQGRNKFAALRVRLPCGSPSSPASQENGLSPASTASVSETRSPACRAAGAGAGASRPDSEGSEACSSSDSEADRDAGSVLGTSAPEPEHGGRGGSRAGTPSPALAAGASPEGPPQQACTTPPAFQLACSSAEPRSSSGTGSSSRALTPAGLSPAQQLEVLAARLEAEAAARRAAQRHLAAQRAEAEQQRQALAQQYEARLVALRQELQQAAEEGAGAVLRRSILVGGSQQLTLSSDELELLRRQLADQEVLLRAYDAENQLAAARLKEQHAEQRRQATEAVEREQVLAQALVQAQAELERQPPGTPAVDAARLQELLKLQAELGAVRGGAAQRERELKQQLDQAAQEQAEWRQRAEASASLLQQVQVQLADSDGLVSQQASVIQQLEQQLLQADSSGGPGGEQRLRQLEAENASLRQAVREVQRQAGSAKAGGSNGDGSSPAEAQLAELRGQVARLQAQLCAKEEQHQRQLRMIQHEHQRLRTEEGIRAASRGSVARVRDLERQLEELKAASARKMRVLESRLKEREAAAALAAARAGGARRGAAAGGAAGAAAEQAADVPPAAMRRPAAGRAAQEALAAATSQLQQKEQRVRRLESVLAQREAEVAALQQHCATADAQLNAAAEQRAEHEREAAALRQAVEEVTAANQALQEQVRQLPALREQVGALRQQAARLQEAEAAAAAAQQAASEVAAQVAAQGAAHAAELQRLRGEHAAQLEAAQQAGRHAAAAEWQPRLAAAEDAAGEWRGRVEGLERDLRSARAGLPWSPTASDFAALERRIAEGEAAAQRREAHWRAVAEEQRRSAEARGEQLRAHFEGALAAKQQQVDRFRRQLDGVLAAARLLAGERLSGAAPGGGS